MRLVSLFSGAGGLDCGLAQAGFKLMLGLDNDPVCAESHELNFPGVPFHRGSITELTAARFTELVGGRGPDPIDLLAGGPPCPPFSKSRFYRKEKPRALDDPNGFETISGFMNVLRMLKPRAFLLENVFGLAYDVHSDALNFILDSASAAGYMCSYRVLNAADFGVPQIRQRTFVIGMVGQDFVWPEKSHCDPRNRSLFEGDLPAWRTAGEVLSDLDTDENAGDEGHFAGGAHHDLLCQVPPGENYLFFTAERGHPKPLFKWRSRYWSFLLKLSPSMPSWTIQARRSNNMGPFHWRNRILRIEEIKRLQSFPDDWDVAGSVEKQWRQIGNAVPPLLARRLGLALMAQLGGVETNPVVDTQYAEAAS
ncbi:MAG TPA: DNA cytosine methyltransferase [Nitrospira sp.]|nr:DNA cytosine methyltransferase [Nitrospira sp.]